MVLNQSSTMCCLVEMIHIGCDIWMRPHKVIAYKAFRCGSNLLFENPFCLTVCVDDVTAVATL